MGAPRVRNSKDDIKNMPSIPPSYIPPPSAGVPVGGTGSGGGALSDGFTGHVGRQWAPARTPLGAICCHVCGSWRGEDGKPFDADAAVKCCDPKQASRYIQYGLLSGEERERVRRKTRGGLGPKEIFELMGLPDNLRDSVAGVYAVERARLMKQYKLRTVDAWHAWQAKRRGYSQYRRSD